jgi:hypothetical protein
MTANKVHKITIITSSHLVNNPRVWKEANALSTAGYDVTIFTTWHSKKLRSKDQNLINDSVNYNSMSNLIKSESSKMQIIYQKVIRKLANYIFYLFNSGSIYQFTARPKWQIKKITESKSDLYICHQETGLLIGVELLKMGYKVAIDFEDWYSEDYLNKFRPVNLLKNAEAFVLKNAEYVSCPSESMAKSMREFYKVKKEINVIYNCFPIQEEVEPHSKKIAKSFLWFSQKIGPGRGIEELLSALQLVETNVEIHFVGKINNVYKEFVTRLLKDTKHVIKFVELLNHNELLDYVRKFEIGLALEPKFPLNKDLTISNKIMLYLQMKLRVVASHTVGQLELRDSFNSQILYVDIDNAIEFSRTIEKIFHAPANVLSNPIDKKYNWELSSAKLIGLVKQSV